jgi:hypothetical protein
MSRSYWSVYILASGNTWELDDYIPHTNSDFSEGYSSNTKKIQLADGGNIFFTPEVKKSFKQLIFEWQIVDRDLYDLLVGYIEADEPVKIVTDINGLYYVGKFTDVAINRLIGQSGEDANSISAIFESY